MELLLTNVKNAENHCIRVLIRKVTSIAEGMQKLLITDNLSVLGIN